MSGAPTITVPSHTEFKAAQLARRKESARSYAKAIRPPWWKRLARWIVAPWRPRETAIGETRDSTLAWAVASKIREMAPTPRVARVHPLDFHIMAKELNARVLIDEAGEFMNFRVGRKVVRVSARGDRRGEFTAVGSQ